MTELILPGVYIEERPEALIVAGPITVGNIGIVGTAQKGPIGEVQILSSFADAIEIFGNYDSFEKPETQNWELTLVRALELAYANGASTVYAIRIASGTRKEATFSVMGTKKENGNDVLVSVATLSASTPGTWGNEIGINIIGSDPNKSEERAVISNEEHIVPIDLKIALSRFPIENDSRNQIKLVETSTNKETVFKVKYFDKDHPDKKPGKGEVMIKLDDGTLTFADNEGPKKDDKVYAWYVLPSDRSRKVTIKYGNTIEKYIVADGPNLVDQLIGNTNGPVKGLVKGDPDNTKINITLNTDPDNNTFKKFGQPNGDSGNNGALTAESDYKTGLESLLNENVHIVTAAGQDTSIYGDLKSHVEDASSDTYKRDRIAVLGSGKNATFQDINGSGNILNSERVIFVGPGIKTTDSASRNQVTLPGAYAAAAIAGMLSARDPHVSLTNKTASIDDLEIKFNPGQLEQLIQSRILALEVRQGIRVVKAITTSTNTAFQQITTRRIVDYAKYGVRSAADPYIGLLNNDRVRKALKGSINGFLASMVDDEMLISYVLDVTATRDEQIRGIARVTMTIQPTFSIDYIKVVMYLG